MAKKFIICEDKLIVGNVGFHFQLIPMGVKKEKCIGGGYWHLNRKDKIMYFYSSSFDFGGVTKEQFDMCDKPQTLDGMRLIFSEEESLEKVLKESVTISN